MRSKYDLKQIVYVPFEIYAISEILRGDEESLLYQVRGTQDKGITLTMTEDYVEKYSTTVPVRHGKWIEYPTADGMNQCSECGVLRFGESNYCPNCGARMVEDE